MDKELELNEEKIRYADSTFGFSNENHAEWQDCQRHFVAGANSEWAEKEKLRFAIQQLTPYLDWNEEFASAVEKHIQNLKEKLFGYERF